MLICLMNKKIKEEGKANTFLVSPKGLIHLPLVKTSAKAGYMEPKK